MGSSGSKGKLTLPSLVGKCYVVTGANSGIGYITALELGKAGANVIVCARDPKKGQEAIDEMAKGAPQGKFEVGTLNLADLSSVKAFVQSLNDRTVDCLINNAGVMNIPQRELTKDGFEMQIGTNFIGHYALTVLMLPLLQRSPEPRVVNVSSLRAKGFASPPANQTIEFVRDPKTYKDETIYGESKALNLILNNELARRVPSVKFIGCHPGVCATNLFRHKYGWATFMMQSPEMGAQSSLRAAVDPSAVSGKTYYGPSGWYGGPKELPQPAPCLDASLADRYFAAVAEATGIAAPPRP